MRLNRHRHDWVVLGTTVVPAVEEFSAEHAPKWVMDALVARSKGSTSFLLKCTGCPTTKVETLPGVPR